MRVIVGAAADGYVTLIWCPCILAEANRVLTWHWIKKTLRAQATQSSPLSVTPALERACSMSAKIWFGVMTEVFHVVDDRPPHEPLWTDTPRDPDDVPIWNAAVRSGAHFVVTSNLADGPSIDEHGRRTFNGIACVSPEEFAVILAWWASAGSTDEKADTTDRLEVPPAYRSFLEDLMTREVARLEAENA